MAVTLKSINRSIRRLLKKGAGTNIIEKKDVLRSIDTEKASLLAFADGADNLGDKHCRQFRQAVLEMAQDSKKNPGCAAYSKYLGRLNDKARKYESDNPMRSIPRTARNLAKVLDSMYKTVDKEFQDKTNLHTCRTSHAVILGTLQTCRIFSFTVCYLQNRMIWELTRLGDGESAYPEPPKYRIEYVETHLNSVISVVNKSILGTGPVAFRHSLEELARMNHDIPLVNDNGEPNTQFFQITDVSEGTANLMMEGFDNPIFIAGSIFVQWKNARMRRLEQEREWIINNIALLRMKLDDMDKDDPEYVRLAKIIARYDTMITKIDRKLSDYHSDDSDDQ